jgi:pimeloyl-ACP methyl ester carboxylesterase
MVAADPADVAIPRPDPSRARHPEETGFIARDGVRVYWERYGDGSPTILLMPTWSIYHSRHWKLQIPTLARWFRVVTFDGRGNGRSDRPADVAAYADTEFLGDTLDVLEASATPGPVVACGLSMGAGYGMRLAAEHPDRVLGLVLLGAQARARHNPNDNRDDGYVPSFEEVRPDDDEWGRFNVHAWRRDWPGFARWFVSEKIHTEPHSTKAIEDGVGWTLETDVETLAASYRGPFLVPPASWGPRPPGEGRGIGFARRVRCPALVVHGTNDAIVPLEAARHLAHVLGAALVEVGGGGHAPLAREPVLVNLLVRDFVRSLAATR